jgi:hypothetical protein
MDDKTWACAFSQQAVAAFLTQHRAFVFADSSGKAPIDLVAYKNNVIRRISVKAVLASEAASGTGPATSFSVQLRSTRYSRREIRTTNFSDADCDVLAVHVVPLNTIAFFWAAEMVGRTGINVSTVPGPNAKWVISDHQDVDKFFSAEASPTVSPRGGELVVVTHDPVTGLCGERQISHVGNSALGLNIVAVVSGSLCRKDCDMCGSLRRRIRARTAQFI